MDFGTILEKWERRNAGSGMVTATVGSAVPADFRFYSGRARDAEADRGRRQGAQEKRRRLRNKRPDAELDIHGKTRDEAWQALETFFGDSRRRGLEKVLVIHGKGNHSSGTGTAVLRRVVMDFIENCPFAGESGRGKAATGGEGVTWVLLKETAEGDLRVGDYLSR